MTNLEQLAAEMPDPDERKQPRDQKRLDAIAAAAPAVLASMAADEEANEFKAMVLEQADEAWRQAQDEEAMSLMLEFDMHPPSIDGHHPE
jgi:hypothetical protein